MDLAANPALVDTASTYTPADGLPRTLSQLMQYTAAMEAFGKAKH